MSRQLQFFSLSRNAHLRANIFISLVTMFLDSGRTGSFQGKLICTMRETNLETKRERRNKVSSGNTISISCLEKPGLILWLHEVMRWLPVQLKKIFLKCAFQQSQQKSHLFLLAWLSCITVPEQIYRGQENVIF